MGDAPTSSREYGARAHPPSGTFAVLKLFVEQAPAALAMFDTEMRYLAASGRWRRDYGAADVPLEGLSHYEVVPDVPQRWKEAHQRCMEGAIEHSEEDLFVRADGRQQWLRWDVRPWRTDAGGVGGLIMFAEDITRRKEAELALQEAKDRQHAFAETTRLLLETASQGIISVDHRGTVLLANTAIEQMFGYEARELKGYPIERLLPSALREAHARHRFEYFTTPRPRPMGLGLDLVGQRKDGSTFPVEVSLNHVATPTGGTAIAFVTDITKRKQAEQALRDHARLASLRADFAHILGKVGSLEAILQEAAALLVGRLGVSLFRIWTLNDATGVLELRASAGLYTHTNGPHARVPVGQFEIGRIAQRRAPHLSNDVLHDPEISDPEWARREGMVAFAGHPVLAADRVVGVMATFAQQKLDPLVLADLGAVANGLGQFVQRSRDEDALKERTAELEQRSMQLRSMAAELTLAEQHAREELAKTLHDGLQQLLFSSKLTLDRLARRLGAAAGDEVRLLERARRELDESIQAARSLSVELFPPMLHTGDLAAGLAWLAERMLVKYGLVVELTADPLASPARRDVRILVFESVRELLFNVVKHAGVNRVSLDLALTAGGDVRITITDTGVGFDSSAIFDSRREQRVGLGLFSVRERLALLGGRLDVASAPGQGSRFTLVAPGS